MKILITGGCGFIGSNLIRYLLTDPEIKDDLNIINLDKQTYAGQGKNIEHMDLDKDKRYKFVKSDICDKEIVEKVMKDIDIVVNFAAESHNDRAIEDPLIFLKTNVIGTQTLLEAAKKFNVKRFHHISTCEVFGDLPLDSNEKFKETNPFLPRTPYNASKAAANHIVMAYYHTFRLPITISHCGNNYGPYQYPEKLIPLFTTNAIENKKLPLFKSSQNKREWIHVLDHCKAIYLIIKKGKVGESYNIGTGIEKSIEEITEIILKTLNKPESLKEYVTDRKGHDRRYLLDCTKIKKELNWRPEIDFEKGIKETILWYKNNEKWWKKLKSS